MLAEQGTLSQKELARRMGMSYSGLKSRVQRGREQLKSLMLTSAGSFETDEVRKRLDISRVLLKPAKHGDLLNAITDALGMTDSALAAASSAAALKVAPRKILLVEDSPVNRKVALELLGRRGHRVEVASNGAEALDALADGSFDLALMDVHMPVMDGLTATRAIRDGEHGSGRHLPIVALTAGATVEDREACLSAGMDNFVSKPFRAEDLYRAVEGVAAEALVDEDIDEGPPTGAVSGDVPCLDWQGALSKLEGDETFLRELTGMFLDQYPAMLTAVEQAVSRQNGDELKRAAHALKGSSQVIGGKAVAAAALELENLGRTGNLSEAGTALRALQNRLAELKLALLDEMPRQEA